MSFCPFLSNKKIKREFDSLKSIVGENLAYYLWNKHEGDSKAIFREALQDSVNDTVDNLFATNSKFSEVGDKYEYTQYIYDTYCDSLQNLNSVKELLDSKSLGSTQDLGEFYVWKTKHRRETLTPEEWSKSMRFASILRDLFPEISLKFLENLDGKHAGKIDMDAMQILIDISNYTLDTIPHEYIHYYIEMFADSDIVKEGITEFGSVEDLVQALGEYVTSKDLKARSWWDKFVDFIKNLLNINKSSKEMLLAELGDAFLTRREIGERREVSGVQYQSKDNKKSAQEIRDILNSMQQDVVLDQTQGCYINSNTGQILKRVSNFKKEMGYDSYDEAEEDEIQKGISDEARENGTLIHGVFESLWRNTFTRSAFPQFSDESIEDIRKIVDKFKEKYELVMSEATLFNAKAGMAGTTDLILRDKTTGKIVVLDYKTKLYKYNGKYTNKKGKKLWGFRYALSKSFFKKSSRDAYDFQLTAYETMLEEAGVSVDRRGIIPIVYSREGDKINRVFISKIFGSKENDESLIKNGFYTVERSKTTEYDVKRRIFGKKLSENDERFDNFIVEIGELFDRISKKLDTQSTLFKLRGKRTLAQDAQYTAEQMQNMTEIDAMIAFTKYAIKQLTRLNNQIQERYKKGTEAEWNLEVLQNYKNISASYNIVNELISLAEQNRDLIGAETVKELIDGCYAVNSLQAQIKSAYDNIGTKLYIDAIQGQIGNVRYMMISEQKKKYIQANPKKPTESSKEFESRVDDYITKWEAQNQQAIENRTRQWLIQQARIADNGFECNGIAVWGSSVYESRDPFVQAMVVKFDGAMNEKDRRVLEFKYKLTKIIKDFRSKYNYGNFAKLREVFDDLVEVSDGVSYLVNPLSAEFIKAQKDVRYKIFSDPDTTFQEKRDAYKAWLNQNSPIQNLEEYKKEYQRNLEVILEGLDDKVKKVIRENLGKEKPVSWYILYKDNKITQDAKDALDSLEYNLDKQYRKPNRTIYKNEKYDKLMSLSDDDPKKQLYLLLLETVTGIDQTLPRSLRLEYRLPGVVKRGSELLAMDGVTDATKDYLSKSFIQLEDDTVRGSFVDDDGKKVRQIPLYYKPNSKITEKEQSYDLPTIFLKWFDAALSYKVKSELEALILQTQATLQDRYTQENSFSLLKKGKETRSSSKKTNTLQQYEAWVDIVFYGNRMPTDAMIKLPFSDKKIDLAKLVKKLVSLSSSRTMTGNVISAINNVLVGEVNQAEEAFAGQYLDKESYTKASKIFAQNIKGLVEDFNRVMPENKLNLLAEFFGLESIDNNMSLFGLMRHSISDYGHALTHIGDIAMKYRFMIGMLLSTEVKDKDGKVIGNLFDNISFEEGRIVVNPEVANFGIADLDALSLKLRRILISLHGNYDQSRAAVKAEQSMLGWMALTLRRWIEPNVERRFNSGHYSNLTGTYRGNMYADGFRYALVDNPVIASVWNFVFSHVNTAKQIRVQAAHWETLDKDTKQNIIRFAVEFGVALIAITTYALLGNIFDDDDDPVVVENIRYQLYRLYTDLTFFVLPTSFTKILKDPFPTITYVNDIIDLLWQFFSPFEEYDNGKHMFDNKLLNKAFKLTPGLKQIGRFQNVSREMEFFMRH